MPELHKLMPPLGVLMDKGYGWPWSPTAVCPAHPAKYLPLFTLPRSIYRRAADQSPRRRYDRVNGQTGELVLLVDETVLAERESVIPDLSTERDGSGRELFSALRTQLSGAEEGACCIRFYKSENDDE